MPHPVPSMRVTQIVPDKGVDLNLPFMTLNLFYVFYCIVKFPKLINSSIEQLSNSFAR